MNMGAPCNTDSHISRRAGCTGSVCCTKIRTLVVVLAVVAAVFMVVEYLGITKII
jgi:hypothetical protein